MNDTGSNVRGIEKEIQVVDVMQVRHDSADSKEAVKTFQIPKKIKTIKCDVFIAGGGTSGVSTALAACRTNGTKVCMTEETDWLGGQMTSQGVSALDENYLVETSGANRSYQSLRSAMRNHYRTNYHLTPEAANAQYINPGNCWVSRLAFEPAVAVDKINEALKPAIDNKQLQVFYRQVIVRAQIAHNKIKNVVAVNLDTGECTKFAAKVFVDATELGHLLALSGEHYVFGAEAKAATGEPHAALKADPELVQDYVFPFVVELAPNTNNIIAKPAHFDEFNSAGKFSFNGFKMYETLERVLPDGQISIMEPFWTYRRLLDSSMFNDPKVPHDIAMINWDSNDFRDHNVLDKPPDTIAQYLSLAKACSMGFLYWLQTEALRDDGGKGYPELKLRFDVLGTKDGLSKHPYTRESRRAQTITTIREQDITHHESSSVRAVSYGDSVGIGLYPIDIHGREAIPGEMHPAKPFQIPLGALVPESISNLVVAAKNIGTTHITNGSYRLHPIEWGIGEAAGTLASCSVAHPTPIKKIAIDSKLLRNLQLQLIENGVPVFWYEDVPTDHGDFIAIQFLAVTGIMRGSLEDMRFNPDQAVSLGDVADSLVRAFGRSGMVNSSWSEDAHELAISKPDAVKACVKQKLLNPAVMENRDINSPATNEDLAWVQKRVARVKPTEISAKVAKITEPITRSKFATWLFNLSFKK